MIESDNYYRRRLEEELEAAAQSGDPSVSHIHLEMARRYRELLTEGPGSAQPSRSGGGASARPESLFACA